MINYKVLGAVLFSSIFMSSASWAGVLTGGLSLVDGDNGKVIAGYNPIPQNGIIYLASLPTKDLSIVANSSSKTLGSVVFALDSNYNHTEHTAPYDLCGDSDGGARYDACKQLLVNGQHHLSVKAYDSKGKLVDSISLAFMIAQAKPVPSPSPKPSPSPSPKPSPLPSPSPSPKPAPSPSPVPSGGAVSQAIIYYQGIYDAAYAKYAGEFNQMVSSGNTANENYYTFQYVLMGTVSMYEATGNTTYLQRAITWINGMIATATISDSNGDKNWSGDTDAYGANNISSQLDDLQGMVELARVSDIILTTPSLSAYSAQGTAIYKFVRDQWLTKWINHRDALGWFYTDMDRTDKAIWDKTAMLSRIMLHLSYASSMIASESSNHQTISAIALKLANGFENHEGAKPRFTTLGSGLGIDIGVSWPGENYSETTAIDTSHANRYVSTLIDLYEHGLAVGKSDVVGVANGFNSKIWNGSTANPEFTNYIDGGNGSCLGRGAYGDGAIYPGWSMLAAYSQQSMNAMDSMLRFVHAGKDNPSGEYNATEFGLISLSGNLARSAKIGNIAPNY